MFVPIDPLGPKKMILPFAQCWSKYLRAPMGLFLLFFMLITTRKSRLKFFFTWKIASFQKFVFSSTSWVHKNALIGSSVIVRIASEPLQIINGGLSHSIIREKIGQNILPREDSLFLKNLVLDLLGLKKMIISLAQNWSENHVCP